MIWGIAKNKEGVNKEKPGNFFKPLFEMQGKL
jgi:hypothetical protein